ncbi:MAG: hypothetical protein V2A66_08655 [Pseudomonadota bacterium]
MDEKSEVYKRALNSLDSIRAEDPKLLKPALSNLILITHPDYFICADAKERAIELIVAAGIPNGSPLRARFIKSLQGLATREEFEGDIVICAKRKLVMMGVDVETPKAADDADTETPKAASPAKKMAKK